MASKFKLLLRLIKINHKNVKIEVASKFEVAKSNKSLPKSLQGSSQSSTAVIVSVVEYPMKLDLETNIIKPPGGKNNTSPNSF